MAKELWDLIHPERDAFAADLAGISDDQWNAPSLCTDWTVRQVVAHMTGAAMSTPVSFFLRFAGSGFSFPKFADKQIGQYLGSSPEETRDGFRAAAHRTTSPPGPGDAWIGEAVIHAEDVRRPLGIHHKYNMVALRRIGDMYVKSNALIGAKTRVQGVRLEATDTDWSAGDGPTARGSMLALVMSMTGRKVFLDELSGEGVEVLRSRD